MVEAGLVRRKLILLENYKTELSKLPKKNLSEFKKDLIIQKAVEKILEEMIQICIDIAKHIVVDDKLTIPDDNKGLFKVLSENGIIFPKTAGILQKMVSFRNVLVHMYEKIDVEIVYVNYRRRLGDFSLFAREIERYISS